MKNSRRSLNLIESDRRKEFYNNFFQEFSITNKIKVSSINNSNGAVFAENTIVL